MTTKVGRYGQKSVTSKFRKLRMQDSYEGSSLVVKSGFMNVP